MKDVLVIQNSSIEGSGNLGKLLESDGFTLHSIYAKSEKILDGDYSLLVILGGPNSANDEHAYLIEEQELIRKYIIEKKPVLGICLGSQLIAKAYGAKVYPGLKKEIGFFHDLKINTSTSNLFSNLKNPFTVFHWHGDTFDLPKNAIRLAHSNDYPNQAFQIETAVGLQFHLEVDETMVKSWVKNGQDRMGQKSYFNPSIILEDIENYQSRVEDNMKTFYKNFKNAFSL